MSHLSWLRISILVAETLKCFIRLVQHYSLLLTEEIDVDVESTDYLMGDLDWSSSSPSDSDERGSMQSICSDEGYSSSGIKRLKLQNNHKPCLSL